MMTVSTCWWTKILVDKKSCIIDRGGQALMGDQTLNRGLEVPTELIVSLTVDVSQVWVEAHVGDPDRRARFFACDCAMKVFQAIVIQFVLYY